MKFPSNIKNFIRFSLFLVAFILVLCCIFFINKNGGKKWYDNSGNVFGTAYHIKYLSKYDAHNLISLELEKINNTFSIFNPNSLVSRLNVAETDSVNDLFKELFLISKSVYKETGGAFDPTVRPAVEAWGFGKSEVPSLAPEKLDSIRELIGFQKVTLEGELLKRPRGVTLDFGAIAKGYAVDRVAEILEKIGIKHYIIEIGGEVRVLGLNPEDNPWQIGIVKPQTSNDIQSSDLQDKIIELTEGSVATSGNYNNIRHINGKSYSHTIDPFSASPRLSDILSATVIAPQCAVADAYATAFMVLGKEKSLKIIALKDSTQLRAILY